MGENLDRLNNTAGVEVVSCGNTIVVYMMDHRMAFLAAWAAIEDGVLDKGATILRLDAHHDFADNEAVPAWPETYEDALIATDRMRGDDGGWLYAVKGLGMAKAGVTWYVQERHRDSDCFEESLRAQYKGPFFFRGSFKSELEHQGDLVDSVYSDANGCLLEAAKWSYNGGWGHLASADNVWVDIDLDFAVHELHDFANAPWRDRDFHSEFTERVNFGHSARIVGSSVADIWARPLTIAKLITIAIEPKYSCGLAGAAHILRSLDNCFSEHGDWFNWHNIRDFSPLS